FPPSDHDARPRQIYFRSQGFPSYIRQSALIDSCLGDSVTAAAAALEVSMADVTVNGVTATADEVLALVRAQADIARREAADRARGYDAAQTLACNTVRAHVVDATRLLMRALECIGSDEATDVLLTA